MYKFKAIDEKSEEWNEILKTSFAYDFTTQLFTID